MRALPVQTRFRHAARPPTALSSPPRPPGKPRSAERRQLQPLRCHRSRRGGRGGTVVARQAVRRVPSGGTWERQARTPGTRAARAAAAEGRELSSIPDGMHTILEVRGDLRLKLKGRSKPRFHYILPSLPQMKIEGAQQSERERPRSNARAAPRTLPPSEAAAAAAGRGAVRAPPPSACRVACPIFRCSAPKFANQNGGSAAATPICNTKPDGRPQARSR